MDHEQIKKRFLELYETERRKRAPEHYSKRIARQTLIKELTALGQKTHDAVYNIFKAEQELFL